MLQGKILVTVAASVLLVGGATAAFAATPAGQNVVQSLAHAHVTVTAAATHDSHNQDKDKGKDGISDNDHTACSGTEDAQNLAASFHLGTSEQGPSVGAICALHAGTFKGITPTGTTVTSSRIFGFGEVDQLLTYAQFLAAHDATNVGRNLTDTNVSSFLAAALHSCGSTPLEVCLKHNIPNFQPGHHGDDDNGNKPMNTPTPPHH